jgi:hypothetical protein
MLKFKSRLIIPTVLLLSTISTAPALANPSVDVFDNTITVEEVMAAQRGWCAGLLAINEAYQEGGFKAAKSSTMSFRYSALPPTPWIRINCRQRGWSRSARKNLDLLEAEDGGHPNHSASLVGSI